MWRARTGRIALAAFVFFVPPALMYFAAEYVRDVYADSSGPARLALLAALITLASIARFLGAIFFAGFLDLAIGDDYFRGERRRPPGGAARHPVGAAAAVDIVVNVAASIALLLFVVPGLVVYVLWGLVGPVVVQERRDVRDTLPAHGPDLPAALGDGAVPGGDPGRDRSTRWRSSSATWWRTTASCSWSPPSG